VLRPDKKFYFVILRIGLALVIAFLICQFPFDYIESVFYDARVRLKPISKRSGHVELIAVDPPTIERLHRVPNAKDHIQMMRHLKASGPKAVVYLINPNEIVGSYDELETLAGLWQSQENFLVAVNETAVRGDDDAFRLLPPFEKLSALSSPRTSDLKLFARDDVTRRMFISYQDQFSLYPVVAGIFNSEAKDESQIHGLFELLGSNQVYIDFRPSQTYLPTSFSLLLEGTTESRIFRDKIVIVGRDIQTTSKDYARTPFSRELVSMTWLELHANMIDTLILNSAPIRSPRWLDVLVTCLISLLTVYVVSSLKPTRGLTLLALTLINYFLIGFLLFWLGGIWIAMAQPFLAVFVSYYFFIPYRLIIENRKSWEYYQKNKLLTQVEELKTNFLSMMSHDLKTPIARIQGMTDVVLKDPNRLSPRQREALGTLAKSSQELLEFVSSILNLGRIESKQLELHLQSRDPNGLLTEAVEKLEHLAASKNIKIICEFEPLFSVKMDVDLMRQVFSNLIENAIKYSPENTSILITSDESDGKVVIQIADQGVGIDEDELLHVFNKFYRSKTAKVSPTKGSGLGLYLAKYFVELHSGTISVDSRPGVGSTFSVELPTSPIS
jgi:signal transduction histidine kinase